MTDAKTMTRDVVVVTGASAGVGRAIAWGFAKEGAAVALLARGVERLEEVAAEVTERGGQPLVIGCDVADFEQVEQAARKVEDELGPITVWVNNAAVTVLSPFDEITPEEYRRVTDVDYLGTVNGTLSALKRFKPRDAGIVIQVGSALAYRAIPLQSAYCGAKHAARGFTDSIRSELKHEKSKVRITNVHLPAINTPQFQWCATRLPMHPQPVPPMYTPEVPARAVVWASKHARRELFVSWSAAIIVFGNKFLPGFGDWYLGKTGYSGQQTDDPVDDDRPSNLYETVPGSFGARGPFTDRTRESSSYLWVTTHRGLVWSLMLLIAIAIGVGVFFLNR